jgi:phytanoyl-CoA hydroxylase
MKLNNAALRVGNFKSTYYQNGYVILQNIIEKSAVEVLKSEIDYILQDEEILADFHKNHYTKGTEFISQSQAESEDYYLNSGDKIRLFLEKDAINNKQLTLKSSLNKIGHCLHDLNPTFSKFTYSELFRHLVKTTEYIKPIVVQSMYIFKNPHIASHIPPHTDNMFLRTRPSSCMVHSCLFRGYG